MTYLDAGYDQFFRRELNPTPQSGLSSSVAPFDFDSQFQGLPADKLTGGQFKSNDGSIIMNLEQGYISVSASGIERIRLGANAEDGQLGMILKSKEGKTIMKLSDTENYISSPDGNTVFDFDNNRILVSENGVPRVLIGYQEGGF